MNLGARLAAHVIVFAFLCPAVSTAVLVHVDGSWSYTITGQGFTNEDFTGSATFSYDTSPLSGSGFENIIGSLATFSQSPSQIGSTTFTTANTGFLVLFSDGVLAETRVGGTEDGAAGTINTGFDDFTLFEVGSQLSATISASDFGGNAADISPSLSFTHTVIPEPSSFLCLGLVALGFVGWKKFKPTK